MIEHEQGDEPLGGSAEQDDRIAPHLVRPLRAAERLDATFSARVMSAVHAEARQRSGAGAGPTPSSGWWRRTRTIELSPLAGLAMAAGMAGLIVLSAAAGSSQARADRREPAVRTAAVPETVHVVRFVFADRHAAAVSLVGDFNGWSKNATPLTPGTRPGTWVVSVALPRGRHEYAFVARHGDAERWTADPFAQPVRDDFGTESSIVTVGTSRSAADQPST